MFYEKIGADEILAMTNEYGFTPNYSYKDFISEYDSDGSFLGNYYIGLTIHKSSDEVYNDWLSEKDAIVIPTISDKEKIEALQVENEALNKRVESTELAILDLLIMQNSLKGGDV